MELALSYLLVSQFAPLLLYLLSDLLPILDQLIFSFFIRWTDHLPRNVIYLRLEGEFLLVDSVLFCFGFSHVPLHLFLPFKTFLVHSLTVINENGRPLGKLASTDGTHVATSLWLLILLSLVEIVLLGNCSLFILVLI